MPITPSTALYTQLGHCTSPSNRPRQARTRVRYAYGMQKQSRPEALRGYLSRRCQLEAFLQCDLRARGRLTIQKRRAHSLYYLLVG